MSAYPSTPQESAYISPPVSPGFGLPGGELRAFSVMKSAGWKLLAWFSGGPAIITLAGVLSNANNPHQLSQALYSGNRFCQVPMTEN